MLFPCQLLCVLKVSTHVHHLNLVRLIGYCVEGSLFIVYEHIGNGNLGQYLHGIGKKPLPWSSRVQIALDSARGLEYIFQIQDSHKSDKESRDMNTEEKVEVDYAN
ncbi:lysM domain receptor kinase [Trifolium repens]|nr:lysM domain receptor kinase [Trifolium repens]